MGLFRPLARPWFRADAGLGRRLGSRDDRPAFLAEGAALVPAPATGGPRHRGARAGPVAARRDRSWTAGHRSCGRSRLDARSLRANDPAVAGDPARPRNDHRHPQLVFRRRGCGGVAGAARPPRLAAPPRPRAHRLSGWPRRRGHTRHQRARGEPPRGNPARLGLWGPRPLLDLPRPGARRDPQHRSPYRRRTARTPPHRRKF